MLFEFASFCLEILIFSSFRIRFKVNFPPSSPIFFSDARKAMWPVKSLNISTYWASVCGALHLIGFESWLSVVWSIDFYRANERLKSRGKRALLLIKSPSEISLIFSAFDRVCVCVIVSTFLNRSKKKRCIAVKRMVYWIRIRVHYFNVFAHSDYVLVTTSASFCCFGSPGFLLFCFVLPQKIHSTLFIATRKRISRFIRSGNRCEKVPGNLQQNKKKLIARFLFSIFG